MQNAKQRPVIFGLFVIVAVIVLGASLAFATGVASPKHSFADDLSPMVSLPIRLRSRLRSMITVLMSLMVSQAQVQDLIRLQLMTILLMSQTVFPRM
jgi:hypothetical protein